MTKLILTFVDTAGIQNYVFGTNNLQQNVGASYLVDCATRKWAIESIPCTHNVLDLDIPQKSFNDKKIENDEIQAEVIYAGGGNIAILFSKEDFAKEFARRLSRKILMEAPGLQILVVHQKFNWETEAIGSKTGVLQSAMRALISKKSNAPYSTGISGMGVTAECIFTGAPAVAKDRQGRLVSSEVVAKLNAEKEARKRLSGLINFQGYDDPPQDFDELGQTSGEKSFLAVIHADGNSMGKRVEAIRDNTDHAAPGEGNRKYIDAMREFSLSVQLAAQNALQDTVNLLIDNIDPKTQKIGDIVCISRNKLPFRPIVFGGDDVTFVCDGRIGLSLAQYYVQKYASQKLTDDEFAHGRAGVAIVHTHYPFSRAYQLAEGLCATARKFIKENGDNFSAMDWHYSTSGMVYELEEIRRREYETVEGTLLMRPVRITRQEEDWRTWDNFQNVVTEFQSGSQWAGRHNKVKALRNALRSGESATRNFKDLYKIDSLPNLRGWHDQEQEKNPLAWLDKKCGYFDAVETVDLYVPLKEGGQK